MKKHRSLSTLGVFFALAMITLAVVLYAQGYRIDLTRGTVGKTGIILAKSVPEGAKVYLDGKLITATNSPIPNLEPGTYRLKIEKEGCFSWERDIPVKEGFVTDVTALLPPRSPSFTAVTQNGVRLVTRAPSGRRAIFISGENLSGKEELYILNLSSSALGFLRTTTLKIAEESENFPLSQAETIRWSPNEDQLLITISADSTHSADSGQAGSPQAGQAQYYLISTTGKNGQPTLVHEPVDLLENWDITITEQKAALIMGLELDQNLATEAIKLTTIWSPDERKFLYEKEAGGKRQFWVVNLSDPLPTGDEAHQLILETDLPEADLPQADGLKLFWLADSHHFAMIDNGVVSLLDLDGSNKRDLFQGSLPENIALSTTDLSRIIILTSIAPETPPNLYAISLR